LYINLFKGNISAISMSSKKEARSSEEIGSSKGKYPRRFLLTCAQASYYKDTEENGPTPWGNEGLPAKLHQNLYNGLKEFAERKDIDELTVFPVKGVCTREDLFHESLRGVPELTSWERHFTKINSNATVTDVRVPPQNVDPATSRKHLTAKYGATLIFPHPKQRMCPVASSSSEFPRFILTTGAITTPNYNRSNDRGDQAARDHRLGAIYVEAFNEKTYLFHFLTAAQDGKFVHLGTQYDGHKKPTKIGIDALVLGDIHWGEHDPETMQANYEMIKQMNPKKVVLHDFFTGNSISHWNLEKPLYRAQQFTRGELSLEHELRSTFGELQHIARMAKGEVYIVPSNHDAFLEKYLESGMYERKDLWNAEVCHSLAGRILRGKVEPDMYLKEALSMFGQIPKNVTFLGLDDKLCVQGYRLSSHGHIGVNGSKGFAIKKIDETMGRAIIGHKHAPEQFRDSYVVGTSSRQNLHYMAGSISAAMGCNAAIYQNGKVQMLPIINGVW